MKYCGSVKVISVNFSNDEVYSLKIERPKNIKLKPGQFFMIKSKNNYPLLNRPISISDYTEEVIDFGIKIVGKETKKLSTLKKGNEINIIGPLGNGFELDKNLKKVLVIGGGIGVKPLKALVKEINNKKIEIKTILGFRKKAYDKDFFEKYSNHLAIFSEKENLEENTGYPTDILDQELINGSYDLVYSCGPEILMEKVKKICEKNNIECQLLLEEKMACGIGACLGCTCKTDSGYKKVCADGPMFYGKEVFNG
ncbi:MAG: dihydroorotate dehydrogenase electron transfer subunit [Bacillota bacterium]